MFWLSVFMPLTHGASFCRGFFLTQSYLAPRYTLLYSLIMETNERLKEELKILKQLRHDLVAIGADKGLFWEALQGRIDCIEVVLRN